MSQIREYKCPSCGGVLHFDSGVQKMRCEYCGTELEVSALEEYNEQLNEDLPESINWNMATGAEWNPGEQSNMRTYVCKSCGGEIMADENTAATSCPFCGSPVVLMEKVSGALRPDVVIPFKLDKEAAKEAYRKHLKGKILLPKMFKEENHIDEIQGIYVPFWLFDASTDAAARYNGTKTSTWQDKNYIYTRTSYYSIYRNGQMQFDHVPVDGSSRMADDMMEAIEPFDFNEAVDFQTAYLAGYLADSYDVSVEDSIGRANARIRQSTENALRSTVSGYSTLNTVNSSIRISDGHSSYALYPVWFMNTTWKGQTFVFAMNGQTGKMVGDLPADTMKLWIWRIAIALGSFALLYLVVWLFQ